MPKAIDIHSAISELREFYQFKKRLPTFVEFQTLFGYSSKGGVSHLVKQFIEKKMIARDPTGKLIPSPLLDGGLKLLGTVQAGFPSPAEEELVDTLSMDEFLIGKPEASYLVKVTGDSMIEAGIMSGDLVIVERGRSPKTGDIVIAQVDGEWTLKFYEKQNGKVFLKAASQKYAPISPKRELVVGGVVIANVRKYK